MRLTPPAWNSSYPYDRAHSQRLAFGGYREENYLPVAQTWAYDTQGWRQLQPSAAPSERSEAGLAYDHSAQVMVLFGGQQLQDLGNELAGNSLQDTWIWDGQRWDRQSPQHSPNLFSEGVLGYDEEPQQVVFWGFHDTEGGRLVTTHIWNDQDWSKLITGSPGPDTVMASTKLMVYDTFQKRLNLIVTKGDKFTSRITIWTWTGSGWEVKH